MAVAAETKLLPTFAWRQVGVVVLVQVAVATALSGRYGFHRDELYFLAAGRHLDWGYVDQPPLTPVLGWLSTSLFGDTPMGLRVVSTLAGAATVVLIALVARELGGGRTVQWVSAAATALSAFVVVVTHMLSTTTIDMLIWVALGLAVMRLLRTGDGRYWVAVGALIGLGMANKWLILLLVSGLAVGVLVFGPRKVFLSAWLWAGVAVAVLITLPIFLWQAAHDFPLLTVAGGISDDDGPDNRILFVPMQLVLLSPILVPVWITGMVRLWKDRALRAFPVAYGVVCVELLALGGKPYYSVPLLMLLVPAGVEPTLNWMRTRARRVLSGIAAAVCVVVSVVVGLPVLPPAWLGPVLAINKEPGEQVGWPDFAATVNRGWQQIPADQRDTAVIFTGDYGQAGAIERYGPAQPYSGHMSYEDWGPPADSMTGPVLLVGHFGEQAPIRRYLTGCEVVAVHDNGYGLDNDEQGTPVMLCSPVSQPWSRLWPSLRQFY